MRLFEVIQLKEYNQSATLQLWGERIAQAAKFNRQSINDGTLEGMWKLMDKGREQDLALVILKELQAMDPTANKQYVMTLVRWYTAVVKVHDKNKKLYAKLKKAEDEYADDWEHGDFWPEDYTDLGTGKYTSPGYVTDRATEDWGIEDIDFNINNMAGNITFKLEDSEQIHDTLVRFESIKPQLQPNERDIGRFKGFNRFEDFVDDAYDVNYVPTETDNKTLKRKDVEVLYNGPLGTVTVPRSHEASCALGSGTKWCTTGKNSYWYDSYSSKGDLIIYNEKPGNAKYQLHVTLNGIEARDARDRNVPHAKELEFLKHPVLSKIIQAQNDKIFSQLAQQPFTEYPDTTNGRDPVKLVKTFIEFNNKHEGGVMRYVDEYYVKYAFADIVKHTNKAPGRDFVRLMLIYAKQRGKPWPEMNNLYMQMLYNLTTHLPETGNFGIKTINRLVAQLDKLGPNPELEKFKTLMIDKIKNPQDKY